MLPEVGKPLRDERGGSTPTGGGVSLGGADDVHTTVKKTAAENTYAVSMQAYHSRGGKHLVLFCAGGLLMGAKGDPLSNTESFAGCRAGTGEGHLSCSRLFEGAATPDS